VEPAVSLLNLKAYSKIAPHAHAGSDSAIDYGDI